MQRDDIIKSDRDALLDREPLVVQQRADELRRQQGAEVTNKPDERTRPHAKVVRLEVARVLVEIGGPEDGQQQDNILAFAGLPQRAELGPERLLPADDDLAAVGALDLLRRGEEVGQRHGQALQRDEDDVHLVADFALLLGRRVVVEREHDGATEEGSACPEPQPDVHVPASLSRLRVAQRDGALACPEQAGGDAAGHGADEDEPLVPVPVVGVQTGGVNWVSDGTEEESPGEADAVGDGTADQAKDSHEAKD